jgi:hypothetical protein
MPPGPTRREGARGRRGLAAAAAGIALAAAAAGAGASAHRHAPAARPARAAAASTPASAASAPAAPARASAAAIAAPTDLASWCRRVTAQVPGVAQPACTGSGLVAGDGRSVGGVPLFTRDVLPASGAPRFKVLLLGGIHGDELTAVTLAFDWIARSQAARHAPAGAARAMPAAARGGGADSPVATMADVAWRFVPLLNPDGLLHAPSTRVNAHGVDLNRNFPTADWARDAQPYWIQRTGRDPRRFPGPRPVSEPESRWLLQQIEQFHPDLIVSVHAPYGLLDFDGPPPVPRRLGSLQLDPVGVYPGSLGNYGGLVKQLPVMTLELKNARQVPPAELAAMWNDLQRWIAERLAHPRARAAADPRGTAPARLAERAHLVRGRD